MLLQCFACYISLASRTSSFLQYIHLEDRPTLKRDRTKVFFCSEIRPVTIITVFWNMFCYHDRPGWNAQQVLEGLQESRNVESRKFSMGIKRTLWKCIQKTMFFLFSTKCSTNIGIFSSGLGLIQSWFSPRLIMLKFWFSSGVSNRFSPDFVQFSSDIVLIQSWFRSGLVQFLSWFSPD